MRRINGYRVRDKTEYKNPRKSVLTNYKPREIPTHNNLKDNSVKDYFKKEKIIAPLNIPDVNGVTQYDQIMNSHSSERSRAQSLGAQYRNLTAQYRDMSNQQEHHEELNSKIANLNSKIAQRQSEIDNINPTFANGQTLNDMQNTEHKLTQQYLSDVNDMKKYKLERELIAKQNEIKFASENLLYQTKINQEIAESEAELHRLKLEEDFDNRKINAMKEMTKNRQEAEYLKAKLDSVLHMDYETYLEMARDEGAAAGEAINIKSMLDAQQKVQSNVYESNRDEEKLKTTLDHLNSSLDRRTRYQEINLQKQKEINKKDIIIKKRNEEIEDLTQQNVESQLKIDYLQNEYDVQTKAMESLQRESRAQDNNKNYEIYKEDTAEIIPNELPNDPNLSIYDMN